MGRRRRGHRGHRRPGGGHGRGARPGARRRGARVLDVPGPHPQRRRRAARALAVGRPGRDRGPGRRGGGPPRHHGGADRARLPQRLQRRGGRPHGHALAPGGPPGQLERPRGLGHEPRGHRAPARRLRRRGGPGGDRGRPHPPAHHADPALLRARGHLRRSARLARGPGPAGPRAPGRPVGPGGPPAPRRGGPVRGGGDPRRPGQSGGACVFDETFAPETRGLRGSHRRSRWRPSGARTPSTPCSTSWWPTGSAPACDRPSPSPTPTGTPGPRSGPTRGRSSGAPTPGPISTPCAGPSTRRRCSATGCGPGACSAGRRRCTS